MSNAAKFTVLVLLLAAAATFAFYKWNSTAADVPMPPAHKPEAPQGQPKDPQQHETASAPVNVVVPTKQDPVRTEAKPLDTDAHMDAAQGVKGRVLQPNGAPAANVPVYLMENSMNDPVKIWLQNKSGERTPPVSSGHTAEDGTFALGVLQPSKAYDLRIVSDDYPEISHQQIKVREEDWFDVGDKTLEVGLVVFGRVVDDATKGAVSNATVFLSSSNVSHAMVATPGRERGMPAKTDGAGNFRFTNAPRTGPVNLDVEAPGYANSQLANQQLKSDAPNEYTIELVRGLPIAGIVVDGTGKPLPGIALSASALSAKTPQTGQATTLANGTFQFESLREGPYQITTNSPQYIEVKTPPVMTGDGDVKIVLTLRPYAKLRVLGANKQPVKAYSLSLKRSFPNNPLGIGNVPEFADRRINPSDYPAEFNGEWAVVRGLPLGDFVFQIQDLNHAKTLTPPFKVTETDAPPEVEVVLTMGAGIMGTVVDDHGQPVSGAIVTTDMNGGINGDSQFLKIFRNFMPEKHTTTSTRTDAGGHFALKKLAFADYMLRIAHGDFCEGTAIDIKLETEGQVVDVGTVQLSRGAIVEGYTTIGGQAAGQVKVTIASPQPETAPHVEGAQPGVTQQSKPAQMLFSESAISDNDGHYRMLKRIPPGVYDISAARSGGDNNPFLVLLDMKETKRRLVVPAGQDQMQESFTLTKR